MPQDQELPLAVDLDGTLIHGDTSHHLCHMHLAKRPVIGLVDLLAWVRKSRPIAKDELARRYLDQYDPTTLTYTALQDHPVYTSAKCKVLYSGSDHRIVQKIADHVSGFDQVRGTVIGNNFISANKAAALVQRFPDGFAYIGDSKSDLKVWAKAAKAYAVHPKRGVLAAARRMGLDVEVLLP